MPLLGMDRLANSLSSADSSVEIALDFGLGERGFRIMDLSIRGSLQLVCQRCLGTVDWPLTINSVVALVRTEAQIERLPDHYEPLLVEPQPMQLMAIVEDEILLALPVVAFHPEEQCQLAHAIDNRPLPKEEEPRQFAALAQLKDQLKKR